jgi:hypothetical protein
VRGPAYQCDHIVCVSRDRDGARHDAPHAGAFAIDRTRVGVCPKHASEFRRRDERRRPLGPVRFNERVGRVPG